MSILTGLFPPTTGSAIVNGFDIRTDITKVRSSLGICPQFNVLFDELTVEEHLYFYCKLKHFDPTLVQQEITKMIRSLDMEDKRHARSKTLSGGMKRKLSVRLK
jgi:ATP-binding cassette, subfamily A (ABC1), member 3